MTAFNGLCFTTGSNYAVSAVCERGALFGLSTSLTARFEPLVARFEPLTVRLEPLAVSFEPLVVNLGRWQCVLSRSWRVLSRWRGVLSCLSRVWAACGAF